MPHDEMVLVIPVLVFTFLVMGGMSFVFAKWMKRHKEMSEHWTTEGGASHGHDHHHH